MTYYQSFRDPGVSDQERATKAIKEAGEIRPEDGPRVEHPDGPCSWWLHGCKTCEDLEKAYYAALRVVFPPSGGTDAQEG